MEATDVIANGTVTEMHENCIVVEEDAGLLEG